MITQDRKETYEQLTLEQRLIVDSATNLVIAEFHKCGIDAANDDRAENLAGAIARYLVDSQK